jgi:hypothetical protein
MDETNILILRCLRNRDRKLALQQAFAESLQVWQEEGFRFSDILKAIADFTLSESAKRAEEQEQYRAIAVLLHEAAELAEISRREIP